MESGIVARRRSIGSRRRRTIARLTSMKLSRSSAAKRGYAVSGVWQTSASSGATAAAIRAPARATGTSAGAALTLGLRRPVSLHRGAGTAVDEDRELRRLAQDPVGVELGVGVSALAEEGLVEDLLAGERRRLRLHDLHQ